MLLHARWISTVQCQCANRPCHGRRFDTQRRIMIRIEGTQLAPQPAGKPLIAGEPCAITAARIVLQRLFGNDDADHPGSLARPEYIGAQSPGGEDHHVLASAGDQDARIVRQLQLDEFAKMAAVVFHRTSIPENPSHSSRAGALYSQAGYPRSALSGRRAATASETATLPSRGAWVRRCIDL